MRIAPTVLCLAALASAAHAAEPLRGKVLETLEAASYTYLRLATQAGETWAAVPHAEVAKGSEVTIDHPIVMDGFESRTLKRTFDRIVFGTLAGAPEETAVAVPMDAAHAGVIKTLQGAPPAVRAEDRIERAQGPGGRTVAEIFANKAALQGTRVTVRGKVVKVSRGILGRTFLHLQDGSGTAPAGDGDLAVTTQQELRAGEVVQVSGVLHLDRDFGAGYRYAVLVEDATLVK